MNIFICQREVFSTSPLSITPNRHNLTQARCITRDDLPLYKELSLQSLLYCPKEEHQGWSCHTIASPNVFKSDPFLWCQDKLKKGLNKVSFSCLSFPFSLYIQCCKVSCFPYEQHLPESLLQPSSLVHSHTCCTTSWLLFSSTPAMADALSLFLP